MSEGDWLALRLSLQLALASTLLLIPLCLAPAWWLARSRWRRPVQALSALPLLLPPTVLGYYLIVAFSPANPVGGAWAWLFNAQFAFSFAGLLFGSVIYSLPFALQPLIAGFRELKPEWSEVAAVLGLSPTQRLLRVSMPQMSLPIVDALALVFAHSMGEFGIVLMIGGGAPQTRTASVALFQHFEALDFAAANRLALALIMVSMVLLAGLYALRRRPL